MTIADKLIKAFDEALVDNDQVNILWQDWVFPNESSNTEPKTDIELARRAIAPLNDVLFVGLAEEPHMIIIQRAFLQMAAISKDLAVKILSCVNTSTKAQNLGFNSYGAIVVAQKIIDTIKMTDISHTDRPQTKLPSGQRYDLTHDQAIWLQS